MLAGVFKTNRNDVLLLLLLIAPALWTVSFIDAANNGAEQAMPLYRILSGLVSKVSFLPALLGVLLCITTAILSNALYNELELFEKRDQLTAILFVVVIGCANNLNSLDPMLCALPLVIIAMRKVYRSRHQKKKLRILFDAGLLVGIAGFFHLPSVLFVIPCLTLLPLLGSTEWRGSSSLLVGALFPFLYYGMLRFALAKPVELPFWIPQDAYFNDQLLFALGIICIPFLIGAFMSIGAYQRSAVRTKNHYAGLSGFMTMAFILGAIELYSGRPGAFALLAMPVAFYSAFAFRRLNSFVLKEALFSMLLALAFWMQWSFLNP